jgi:hypothetical protein
MEEIQQPEQTPAETGAAATTIISEPFFKKHALPIIAGLLGVLLGSGVMAVVHQTPTKNPINQTDTAIVAYNNGGQYLFNKAIVWTHMGRKFKSDSGLAAEQAQITQFSLRLPTTKADSSMDSATHKWLVKDSYSPIFLSDSLSKYIHIIDTIHTK